MSEDTVVRANVGKISVVREYVNCFSSTEFGGNCACISHPTWITLKLPKPPTSITGWKEAFFDSTESKLRITIPLEKDIAQDGRLIVVDKIVITVRYE
jgi:hypothetical protein